VDTRSEARTFLTSRRAKITPEQAGLPVYGARRVPGLRRAEVAQLAGVSVEYYSRLERGDLRGVSQHVLDALARALQLDDAERAHLTDLARAAGPAPRGRRRPAHRVRPSVQRLLDAMTSAPAFVRNGRLDVLATNALARALYAPIFDDPIRPANTARFNFLDPRAAEFWSDWDRAAAETVALLRTEAGRDPYDKALAELVGTLSTRNEGFRTRWATHDVRLHSTGVKHFHHPVVGDLHLTYESMELPADTGLTIVGLTAEPGSPSEDGLRLLASWAASHADMTHAMTGHGSVPKYAD
jgi:transcriptional regulator with XRE-family HTH domain